MKLHHLLLILGGLSLCLFFSGCATSEDNNDIPWSQPQGWQQNGNMPGTAVMPNYGDRQY